MSTEARLITRQVEKYELIIPRAKGASKIEVYRGFRSVKGFSISVTGSGAWASGTLDGKIKTYSYKALYEIYQLEQSKSVNVWIFNWQRNAKQDELVKVFEETVEQNYSFDLKFKLQGNDYGITDVLLGFTTVRVDYEGQTKFFTVPNANSAGAVTPDGDKYPGGFEAV